MTPLFFEKPYWTEDNLQISFLIKDRTLTLSPQDLRIEKSPPAKAVKRTCGDILLTEI
jgi:hypothetical protein